MVMVERGHGNAQRRREERGQPVFRGPARQARHGKVEQDDPESPVGQHERQRAPHRRALLRAGLVGHGWLRTFAQQEDKHDGIGQTDEAEPVERRVPREERGHRGAEAADGLAHVEPCHVDAYGQRARAPGMPVGNERESRGDVERFAHAHHRPQPEELPERLGVAHEVRHARPYEQAAHDEPLAAHLVGHNARHGAGHAVDPQENAHEQAEHLALGQFADVGLHGLLHGGKHLAVHIVEQRHHPEQRHDQPRIKFLVFHG